jgi:hypothetical protein
VSPTPTAFGTAAAHQTQTSIVSALTSTSSALTASPTPTNLGGVTSTPNATELTATSYAVTGTPMAANMQATLTGSPNSSADHQIPHTSGQSVAGQGARKMFWMLEVGLVILLFLFFMLNRELKRNR